MSDADDSEFARKQLGPAAAAPVGAAPGPSAPLDVAKDMASGPPDTKEDGPQFVRLPSEDYNLSHFASEVGSILNKNGVFRRDDLIVTVNKERGTLVPMEANRFRTYVERHCTPARFVWTKASGGTPEKREMTMSAEVARGTLASDVFVEQQRSLDRVNQVPSPVWRDGVGDAPGVIELLQPGYDAPSRSYTVGAPGVVISGEMSMEDALKCLRGDLLREFPFAERNAAGVSRAEAVHVALMLSVWAPALVPVTAARPGGLWMANAPRTGKTLLAKTVQIPVFGTASVTPMKTDEEFDKVLDTATIEAWPVLFLDNLTGLLKSPSLDAFMTSPTRRARVMGGQKSFAAARSTQVLITGNNLGLSEDLEERFLICDLYLEDMDPRARKIERRIDEGWLARPEVRSRILSALWALVRHWDAAGRPLSKSTIPGFETWSEVYGGIIQHAGLGNPLERPQLAYGGNDWKRDLMAMLEALADDVKRPDLAGCVDSEAIEAAEAKAKACTSKEFTFAELVDCCRELDCFTSIITGKEHRDKESKVWFEADAKTKSTLGRYFGAQFGGRVGVLGDGRRVRFGSRGKQRHHRFIVELL
jgi:hypothetical protein